MVFNVKSLGDKQTLRDFILLSHELLECIFFMFYLLFLFDDSAVL